MAVTPDRTPGSFGAPPAHAPHEISQPEDPVAHAQRARLAQQNERQLQPLIIAPPKPPAPVVRTATIVQPGQSRLRIPGVAKPPVTIAADSVPAPTIILTDANPALESVVSAVPTTPVTSTAASSAPVISSPAQDSRPARPPVDPTTAAHLDSPLAAAARKLAAERQLTHQPAASNTDSPSRGIPTPAVDPGKQITGGFGDAADAQYHPLNGSELRELVRGLMSVIDDQIENDLRFSMAITYPRVSAKVSVEITGYAAGGDGGQYDPSFSIVKVMPPHDKTPLAIAAERADSVCFVVIADRREMTADGRSIAPPNAIREELGLAVPHRQAVQTPQGRLIVDLLS